MEEIIQRTMKTEQVEDLMERLSLSPNQLTEIWFDSGIEFLEQIKKRISRKRVFDAQFKLLLRDSAIAEMTPEQMFGKIRISQAYWSWWATMLWILAGDIDVQTTTDLAYYLERNNQLIPLFILKKVFYGSKNVQGRQRSSNIPASAYEEAERATRKSEKEVGSRV